MYFDLCKLKINGKEVIVEKFEYHYGTDLIGEMKKTFKIFVPLGFNKSKGMFDGYPIFHNLLLSKQNFELTLEVNVNDEWVLFSQFNECRMLNKSCVTEPFVSFMFSGTFDGICENNDVLMKITNNEHG